ADLSRKRWEKRWENHGGGFARLYDADIHAAPYLSKYLNKSRGGEIRWGGRLDRDNTPSLSRSGSKFPV
ncbi:unnamed protein product, partial [marine sediment metagenome]